MDIIIKNIEQIRPYEKNPRKNNEAVKYVAESIKQFGFKVPIVIDKEGVIVAGHTRYKASLKLGLKEVPCIVADDLTPEQVKAFRLADNKTSEKSEWDFDLLDSELEDILNFNMEDFGFEFETEDESKEVEEDDFDVDKEFEDIQEPIVKKGEVWKLGDHYLMCGDATSKEDVEKLMSVFDKSDVGGLRFIQANLLVTDPPYNVDYEGKTKDSLKIKNDNMGDNQFKQFLTDSFSNANEVMKEGASFYIWHADSEGYNFRSACKDVSWKVRQCLIWNKNTMVMGRQDYQWKHEPCLYGWKDGASHNWYSDRKQTTVLEFDKPLRNEMHPTMKPVNLIGYLICNSSKKGDVVLDIFGGSGTTLIACEQLERQCRMMELDSKYCDVIIKRWETLTDKKGVKIL